jgi:hypothetical protein
MNGFRCYLCNKFKGKDDQRGLEVSIDLTIYICADCEQVIDTWETIKFENEKNIDKCKNELYQ